MGETGVVLMQDQIAKHVAACAPSRRLEAELELKIAGAAIEGLLAAGFAVSVSNGGEDLEIEPSRDAAAIMAALFATDEDWLIVPNGWVRLIWGNGADVLSDYTMNLEQHLLASIALAEFYQ